MSWGAMQGATANNSPWGSTGNSGPAGNYSGGSWSPGWAGGGSWGGYGGAPGPVQPWKGQGYAMQPQGALAPLPGQGGWGWGQQGGGGAGGGAPTSNASSTIDWSKAPFTNPGANFGTNKGEWRSEVGADENWIQKEMGSGEKITGAIPGMFKGDILQQNRYGTMAPNIDTKNNQILVTTNQGNVWRPMTQDEISQLNQYQNFAYGEEDKQGGGAVQAWGKYQGYGNDTASNDWGGAYSAYMAQQAINAGVSPGAGYGFGTTAGSSPLGTLPGGQGYYNNLRGGTQYFDQYGVPINYNPSQGQGAQPYGYGQWGMPPMGYYGGGYPYYGGGF